ncbi:MAG TPA: amino acid kinase [Gammaproteobacteria bacterium]|nr:amino acid kinase [Gammaproteobacteria bacterium]
MWVIKLGGSLYRQPSLAAWLDQVACYGSGQVVVVPGGGPFADQVRAAQDRWRFPDAVAHRMALQAMDQFGQLLLGLRPDLVAAGTFDELREALATGRTPIWMAGGDPAVAEVPASWEVTSDSLAAFLARRLGAERLLLVKSEAPGGSTAGAAELSRAGVVDAAFPGYLAGGAFSAWIAEAGDHGQLRDMLYTGASLGLRVLPEPARAPRSMARV